MKARPLPPYRQIFLEWYHATTFGQSLQALEATYLQSMLKLTYNQKILQVGRLGSETLYIDKDFFGNFALVDDSQSGRCKRLILGAADELPIASESMDTLILPHVLEFEIQRHQVLREAERVLKPEGKLYILALNPWSLRGIAQYLPRRTSFWRADFVSSHRLLDWLSLLCFEAEFSSAFSLSATQALGKPATLWSRTRAGLSFAYAVKAIKRRYSLIPIQASWIQVPTLAAGHMFENHDKISLRMRCHLDLAQ